MRLVVSWQERAPCTYELLCGISEKVKSSPVLLWLDASNYVHFINKWTEFQEELRRKRYTAQSIGRYRILRLRLSQLVSRSASFDNSYSMHILTSCCMSCLLHHVVM
ncbi:uncharacterized protein LOC110826689 isoform X3 [Zootermopsis nevadensis]|uniref:uncharacterized protein LOC110826689 isoform X3 n=1 Tax=Zootermopsis nevadensis TaxID=136037 RepID=UPI000B8E7B7A|nr:uncharacterized protein LOC110826689 isoform X3 [Zootermopsis nevadensis]